MRDHVESDAVTHDFAAGWLTRREAIGRLARLGVSGAGAVALLAACGAGGDAAPEPNAMDADDPISDSPGPAKADAPNILLVIADDMRFDHLPWVPNVRELIQSRGRTFTQARCNLALCQPARVGLMTGQMSKHNNEISIGFNGTQLTDDDNCIGSWMHEAGYRCALLGKYINFTDGFQGIDAPAGYEVWREIIGEKDPYDFEVHVNAGIRQIVGEYSTDYLAREAIEFIDGGGPFFCIITPTQPHAPFTPRNDLVDLFSDFDWPIVEEDDVSDKPPWVQELEPFTDDDRATIQRDVRGALRELAAVDDMVRQIVEAMSPDVLANTVVIFTSDNGVHHGEHRRRGAGTKSGPYDVGLRVPLIVGGPGFEAGPDITAPSMVFQDLTATLLQLGGATAGLPEQHGVSLATLVADEAAYRDRLILHEGGEGFERGDGVTTGVDHPLGHRKLFRFPPVRDRATGPYVFEAYDLDTDPDELDNWADDASRRDERDELERELLRLLA